ncbi:MAG: OmpA family protein [Gemmatimonadota bacterium]
MSVRILVVGVLALVAAIPAAAQVRGTMELGAFGAAASFDKELSLKTGYGGGGRIGMFFAPRLSVEFEGTLMKASRPNGLKSVNMGILSGRLVAVPLKMGGLSVLLGAGAGVSTETNFLHTYGADVLVGLKFAIGDNAALRIDGIYDWLANEDWKSYRSLHAGLSLYRHPSRMTRVDTVITPASAPAMVMHQDSVSAAETRRLRERDAALRALRDSLQNVPRAPSTAEMAVMDARIQFAFDKSELTDSAKAVLDEKVVVFRNNPGLSIAIVGHTGNLGTDAYNLALGMRRAEAAKAYIVSRGIDASRITIQSKGEAQLETTAPGMVGQVPNRRAIFRLRIDSARP